MLIKKSVLKAQKKIILKLKALKSKDNHLKNFNNNLIFKD